MKKFEEIIIFVAGASPQIITETIYALATLKKPIYPDQIYIITTTAGREIIRKTLIQRKILDSLFEEYNIVPVSLKEDNFLIPKNAAGEEIDDIKTAEDNESMAELITSFLREKAGDHRLRLHCSIAGGRKTMSFYLGAALQLFGRSWDRLYHVIVSPPEFESHPDFFFKPRKNRFLTILNTKGQSSSLPTEKATIHLIDLPFIRLGRKIQLKSASFKELVAESQTEIELSLLQPEIKIRLSTRRLEVQDSFFQLPPTLLFIYTAFLKQKTHNCQYPEKRFCLDCTSCYAETSELFEPAKLNSLKSDYLKISGGQEFRWTAFISRWKAGIPAEVIRQYISKINRQIESQLGDETLTSLCKITSRRQYAGTRYGLKIDKNKIYID